MQPNMSALDRRVRLGVGILIAALYYTGNISGTLALVLGIVGFVLVSTSFIGVCPLYKALGFSTSDAPSAEELAIALSSGSQILDVRTPAEFKGGHAKGARNIPLQQLPQHIDQVKGLPQPIIVCCRSGARSSQAKKLLTRAGIETLDVGPWTVLPG